MGEKLRDAERHAAVAEKLTPHSVLADAAGPQNFFSAIKAHHQLHLFIFLILCTAIITVFKSPPLILIAGALVGLTLANPIPKLSKKIANTSLGISIASIGLGISFQAILASLNYAGLIVFLILVTICLGYFFSKIINLQGKSSLLISAGTAICGGSAIMATSASIDAHDDDVIVSLGTVFLLNAIALICLPTLGRYFDMSPATFGAWAALAIHDTGSVMAATLDYGQRSLESGTAIKVLRALFIVPMVLSLSLLHSHNRDRSKSFASVIKKTPWFIPAFFCGAMIAFFFPAVQLYQNIFIQLSKMTMLIALLLLGTSIHLKSFQKVGLKALFVGACLWASITVLTFFLLTSFKS